MPALGLRSQQTSEGEARYQQWSTDQGARFSPDQRQWLDRIKDYVALNGAFDTDERQAYLETWQGIEPDGAAFKRAKSAFSNDPQDIIEELNRALIA